jgi:hypothetical protein
MRGGEIHEFRARRNTELPPDARSVPLRSAHRDVQAGSDFAVRVAPSEQSQDLALAGGKELRSHDPTLPDRLCHAIRASSVLRCGCDADLSP